MPVASLTSSTLTFAKAFDKVPHACLLAKLRGHGIVGNVASWIEAWLLGRKQRVVLNGSASNWAEVSSGVPQGSILGPLLFLVFINDIDLAVDTVNTALFKFADDTKGIRRSDSPSDCAKLLDDLDNLSKWATQWQMLFNIDKCHILHLGKHNPLHQYSMNGVPLKVA